MATHMLQQGHDLKRERKSFNEVHEKLFKLWDAHSTYKRRTEQLLEKLAKMKTSFNATRYGKNTDDTMVFGTETVYLCLHTYVLKN